MRGSLLLLALLAPCVALAKADDADLRTLSYSSRDDLKQSMLQVAQEKLAPLGLIIDSQRARLLFAAGDERLIQGAGTSRMRMVWAAAQPDLLSFELQPVDPPGSVVHALLAAPLLRQVWVAVRRLTKGSAATCGDFRPELRDWRRVARDQLSDAPCEIPMDAVALREVMPRDVLREGDLGSRPDVLGRRDVQVVAQALGVSVATGGVALADGRTGESVAVRLAHPARTVHARVAGPDTVLLMEGAP